MLEAWGGCQDMHQSSAGRTSSKKLRNLRPNAVLGHTHLHNAPESREDVLGTLSALNSGSLHRLTKVSTV